MSKKFPSTDTVGSRQIVADGFQGWSEGLLVGSAGGFVAGSVIVGVTAFIKSISGETLDSATVQEIIQVAMNIGAPITGGLLGSRAYDNGKLLGFLTPVRNFIEKTYGRTVEKTSHLTTKFSKSSARISKEVNFDTKELK